MGVNINCFLPQYFLLSEDDKITITEEMNGTNQTFFYIIFECPDAFPIIDYKDDKGRSLFDLIGISNRYSFNERFFEYQLRIKNILIAISEGNLKNKLENLVTG